MELFSLMKNSNCYNARKTNLEHLQFTLQYGPQTKLFLADPGGVNNMIPGVVKIGMKRSMSCFLTSLLTPCLEINSGDCCWLRLAREVVEGSHSTSRVVCSRRLSARQDPCSRSLSGLGIAPASVVATLELERRCRGPETEG